VTIRPLTLMAVHAHPDDEVTGTGAVLARYAAEGHQTIVVTCTDGGCGDGPGGVKPGEPGHDPAAVVKVREAELEASCAILQVSHLERLGYADSGMMGWPNNEAPHAFWNTPVEEAAARLAELIRRYRPDVVVTYDPNGFYGHPDHIQTHRITMAALASLAPTSALTTTGEPIKVYWTTFPHSRMAEFGRVMRELGEQWDEPEPGADGAGPEMGLPDDEVTTWVDARDYAQQKFDALAAHASQSDNIFFLKMGLERFREQMGIETFVRVDDPAATQHEEDLFAGRS
jgi:LmbE family N-acetylglucosaminyl deacetylase